jgi:hypothetical protein
MFAFGHWCPPSNDRALSGDRHKKSICTANLAGVFTSFCAG